MAPHRTRVGANKERFTQSHHDDDLRILLYNCDFS